jgi:hypothetical protein
MTVNIAGTFKKDQREYNGLEAIASKLIDDPLTRRVVVGVVETKRIVRDMADGGTETAVVRFVHLEAVDGDQGEQAKQMLAKAYTERTGGQADETLFDHAGE